MAAPHVAGAILLLKEAFPYLGGKDLKLALYRTCRDLGEPGEDNKFGMGIYPYPEK
jgi:bacillopeptidase F